MNTPYDLDAPLPDSGIPTVNFFNGRLLTARDLSREQEARRITDRRLGQAVGAGVAWGLEVAKSDAGKSQVTLQPGLAVNRAGQTLVLEGKEPRTVQLVCKSSLPNTAPSVFEPCGKSASGTYVAGPGLYVLTIAPGTTIKGKAPTNGHDLYGGKCNIDVIVETVQFRLVSLDTTKIGLDDPTTDPRSESLFRNRLVAPLFRTGDPQRAYPLADVGSAPLGILTGDALSDCDVPLALIYLTLEHGIRFVDPWAVRRAVTAREADPGVAPYLSNLRRAESECFPRQFQAQLDWLLRDPGTAPASLAADTAFAWLPPAGVLPVGSGGVDWRIFLGPMAPAASRDTDAALIPGILLRALALGAVEVPDFILARELGEAPAPLDVFRVPEAGDFVVFARSERGRIRIFLAPSSAGTDAVVTVERENPSIETEAIKVDGVFVASDLEPGSHTVQVEAAGYVPDTEQTSVCAGRTREIRFSLTELPKGKLLISLVDKTNKSAITNNASVRAVKGSSSTSGTLDDKKKWAIGGLNAGTYTLIAQARGYRPETIIDAVVESDKETEYTVILEPISEIKEKCVTTMVTFPDSLKSGKRRLCAELKEVTMVKDERGLDVMIKSAGLSVVMLDAWGNEWLISLGRWLISVMDTSVRDIGKPRVYLKEKAGVEESIGLPTSPTTLGLAVFGKYVVPLNSGRK